MRELLMATVIVLFCCSIAHAENLELQDPGQKNNLQGIAEQIYDNVSAHMNLDRGRRGGEGSGNASTGKGPSSNSSGNYELLGRQLRNLATDTDDTP